MNTATQFGRMCAWMPLVVASFCQAQDADALNRAQRDAQNPLRMIIEASKLKPRAAKAGEAEPAARPAAEKAAARPASTAVAGATPRPAAPDRAVPAATATAPVAAATAATTVTDAAPAPADLPLAEAPTAAPAAEPGVAAMPVPDPAPSAEPVAAAPVPAAATPEAAASAPEPTREPAAQPAADAPLQVARAAASAVPALAVPPVPRASLQLVDYVEPQLPERLRRRLRADGEVLLAFTVNPDGSVADVEVRSTSDRALDPIALDAVRQWRYQPIGAAQPHAVQLVFRRE